MSDLGKFVRSRNNENEALLFNQSQLNRRAAAEQAKVKISRSNKSGHGQLARHAEQAAQQVNGHQLHAQQTVSTAPPVVPVYAVAPLSDRNYDPQHQDPGDQHPINFVSRFNEPVSENFDATLSTLSCNIQHGDHQGEYDAYHNESEDEDSSGELSEDARTAYHNAGTGQALSGNGRKEHQPAIIGRFSKVGQTQQQHENMQIRQSQQVSSKRSGSDEQGYRAENQQNPSQHAEYDQIDDTPDYTPERLGAMQFEDLKKETWETEPHGKRQHEPEEQQGPLKHRLNDILNIEIAPTEEDIAEAGVDDVAEVARNKLWGIHSNFFRELSIAEWEESGDLLIGRMSEIMKNMVAARQERRKMVSEFEKRIEERELLVRGKSAYLDEKLKDMKKSGQGLLSGTGS